MRYFQRVYGYCLRWCRTAVRCASSFLLLHTLATQGHGKALYGRVTGVAKKYVSECSIVFCAAAVAIRKGRAGNGCGRNAADDGENQFPFA
jgi:hypothetical protein